MKKNVHTQPLFFNQKEEMKHKRQEDRFFQEYKHTQQLQQAQGLYSNVGYNEVVKKSFKPREKSPM